MTRNLRLVLPLALIGVGVMVLLANTGVLSQATLARLGDLWPLLLVILGLQLILNHTLPRRQASVVGMAAAGVIVVAALAYAALAPSATGTRQADFSQRLRPGLSTATLVLSYGGSKVDVRADSLGDALYRAHVEYPGNENPPTITLDQERGSLEIRREASLWPFRLFGSSRRELAIALTDHIPWTLQIGGGASEMNLDLRHLQLQKLAISGGVSHVKAQLPSPKGSVAIAVSGGASNLTLRAPKESEWRLSVSGGASSISINGASSGGNGGFQRQSPGYANASNRFDIQISGGASHVDFTTG